MAKKTRKKKAKKKVPTEEPWIIAVHDGGDDVIGPGPKSTVRNDLKSHLESDMEDPQELEDAFKQWSFYVIDRTREVEAQIEFDPDIWLSIKKRGDS